MPTQRVNFPCRDCAEPLRGAEGEVATCPFCGDTQDAPYLDDAAPELTPAPELGAPAPETAPDGCDVCGRTGAAARRTCSWRRACTCWRGVACDGLTRAARRAARKAETAPAA